MCVCDSEADGGTTPDVTSTVTAASTTTSTDAVPGTVTTLDDTVAFVTDVSAAETTSRVSASVTDELLNADTVPGSPHTAASSISSPSELSTDVIDDHVIDTTTATMTIPLVRSPSTADTTLHIRPQALTQTTELLTQTTQPLIQTTQITQQLTETTQPLIQTTQLPTETVTSDTGIDDMTLAVTDMQSVTVDSVSELSAAGVGVSENGLSAVTTSSVLTSSGPGEATADTMSAARATLSDTITDTVSDEVRTFVSTVNTIFLPHLNFAISLCGKFAAF